MTSPIETAPIFDADQHMYEAPEALTRYLPEEYKRDVQFVQVGRRTRIAILGKITEFIPNPTFDRVAAPGAHEKFYAGTNIEGRSLRELTGDPIDALPAFREPEPRIASLDAQGVAEAFVYPTLANLVEHSAAEEPELVIAMIHALNRWMLDTWGYTYKNRLFMTPVVTLSLVDEAQRARGSSPFGSRLARPAVKLLDSVSLRAWSWRLRADYSVFVWQRGAAICSSLYRRKT